MNNVDCVGCHQLGQEATRTIPAQFGQFKSGEEAWMRRIASGQSGEMMTNRIAGQLGGVPYKYFGDWTDRVAKGELPKNKPQRPQGVERNVVVTTWDWSTPDKYLHDLISSDRRNPTVNANGKLYGAPEYSTDNMPILDPEDAHGVATSRCRSPIRTCRVSLGPGHAGAVKPTTPSAYWGDEVLWDTRANKHNAMFDKQGRVWLAATVRGMDNPAFCKKGSDHPSAKVFPLDRSPRQVAMLDPKTMKYSFIDTCFGTHHPQFGYDADDTLWLSGTGPVAGWVNTKIWDETGDAQKAVGWFAVRARHQRQRQARRVHRAGQAGGRQGHALQSGLRPLRGDAASDRRLGLVHRPACSAARRASCASIRRPSSASSMRCRRRRSACAAATSTRTACSGARARPAISSASTGASARRRSTGRTPPAITARRASRSTSIRGRASTTSTNSSAEASYYTWVDHHNAVGLGENVPISTANLQDGFVGLSRTAR